MNNEEQIHFWNSAAAERWVRLQETLDRVLEPVSDAVLEAARILPGERVLDIGCGCGATSLALAAQGASVVGVDVSRLMLERAGKRAAGLSSVSFVEADAADAEFTEQFDLLFSRFGVMFFARPVAAFRHLRKQLKAGGRLCFICWQPMVANEFFFVTGAAVQPFLPPTEEPPDLRAPGPFAFADADYLTWVLQEAGFTDIRLTSVERRLRVATTLDQAVSLQQQVGPISRVLADMDEHMVEKVRVAAKGALAAYASNQGVYLGSATWLVTAGIDN